MEGMDLLRIEGVDIAHEYVSDEVNSGFTDACRRNCGIVYCIGGEGEFRIDGFGKVVLLRGMLLFLPRGIRYSLRPLKDFRHYTVNFRLSASAPQPEVFVLSRIASENFISDFSALCRIWAVKAAGYRMRALGLTYKLLADAVCEREQGELEKSSAYLRLLPAKQYIDAGYTEKFSIADLAALVGMSETNFRRSFKRVFGETAISYRDKLRMLKARDMLSVGYYTCAEVAAACGFDDPCHFSRFYKERAGKTPKGRRRV